MKKSCLIVLFCSVFFSADVHAEGLSKADLKAISESLMQCWQPPAEASKLKPFSIRVELNRDKTTKMVGLNGKDEFKRFLTDVPYRLAVQSAIEATKQCAPYTFPGLAEEHYEAWKTIKPVFDISYALKHKPATPAAKRGSSEDDLSNPPPL